MSRYLDMWAKIKELTPEQTDDWINAIEPAKGIEVDFRGVRVNDIDCLEALMSYKEQIKGGAWFVFAYDMQAYPIGLHGTEIEALRQIERQGYGRAVFWPFGKDWNEVSLRNSC